MNHKTSLAIGMMAMLCTMLAGESTGVPAGASPARKIVVIKADDMRAIHPNWDRFFFHAKEKDIKVSVGIFGNSIESPSNEYAIWLKKSIEDGRVEYWNHCWDHEKWGTKEAPTWEYCGSGYEHQKAHFERTQAAGRKLGFTFRIFGAPYNQMDADTVRVINESPDIQGVFIRPGKDKEVDAALSGKVLLPMHSWILKGEAKGTGKPDSAQFQKDYSILTPKGDVTMMALQFHPTFFTEQGFTEYEAIIDFLKKEGWEFLLPSEFAALKK
mgnify:CR=1 FL=1